MLYKRIKHKQGPKREAPKKYGTALSSATTNNPFDTSLKEVGKDRAQYTEWSILHSQGTNQKSHTHPNPIMNATQAQATSKHRQGKFRSQEKRASQKTKRWILRGDDSTATQTPEHNHSCHQACAAHTHRPVKQPRHACNQPQRRYRPVASSRLPKHGHG